jgi:hypothetical protein
VSEPLAQFIRACQVVNPVAASRAYPPFAAPFGSETPLNSAPYIFSMPQLHSTFGTSTRRSMILAEVEAALEALRAEGMIWHLLLVGGSFIRQGSEPSDLDALVAYSLDSTGVERTIRGVRARLNGYPLVDFKFCPIDTDPIVLVKRLLFFANLFSYDKQSHGLSLGCVMVIPGETTARWSAPDDQ